MEEADVCTCVIVGLYDFGARSEHGSVLVWRSRCSCASLVCAGGCRGDP